MFAAKAWINARLAQASAGQRAPHVATAARHEESLALHDLRPHERAMLTAHAKHRVLTGTQLAQAAGWSTHHPANSCYGLLGQAAAEFLELTPLGEAMAAPLAPRRSPKRPTSRSPAKTRPSTGRSTPSWPKPWRRSAGSSARFGSRPETVNCATAFQRTFGIKGVPGFGWPGWLRARLGRCAS